MPVIRESALDLATKLTDAGLITESTAGVVSSAARVVDFKKGASSDRVPDFRGEVKHNVLAIETDSSNEVCGLEWQLSQSSAFSTYVTQSVFRIGDTAATFESADTALGEYRVPVSNEHKGTTYRYGRLFRRIAGTIGTGFSVESWLTPRS